MAFCKTCGNLLRSRRSPEGKIVSYCSTCSDTPDQIMDMITSEEFIGKLKNTLRAGRAEKALKSLSRVLSLTETQLHEVLKTLDDDGKLPYGYYDKIERMYVRTHLMEDIPEELMLDMVKQSFGNDIFGAKSLANYISLGKHTSVRKVLQSLHNLRKKGMIKGFKKGARWLWRLPRPDEDPKESFFPKKEKIMTTNGSSVSSKGESKEVESAALSDLLSSVADLEDVDWDKSEEDEDDEGVFFADPENDPDNKPDKDE